MDKSRIESLDLRSETPRPNPPVEGSLDFYFEKLRTNRKVTIPCPHGHGEYHITLDGNHWYDTPEVVFQASKKCPAPYNDPNVMQAGRFRTNRGRVIPWYPNKYYQVRISGRIVHDQAEYKLQLGRFIVGYILSGRRLYKLKCGQGISSLNTDASIGLDQANDYGEY